MYQHAIPLLAPDPQGDVILTAAYSHELPRYGIKVGLTNYAACYATGLLCARRLLTKLGLADTYKGNEEAAAPAEDGGLYHVEEEGDVRPFRAFLDVGLVRTTTGSKVFAVMKGAVDGGLDIPHNEKRFPGYDKESDDWAETLREHVFGGHVSEYMTHLQEEDEDRYKKQFANYIKEGVDPDSLEEMYQAAHTAIREDPTPQATEKKVPEKQVRHQRYVCLASCLPAWGGGWHVLGALVCARVSRLLFFLFCSVA